MKILNNTAAHSPESAITIMLFGNGVVNVSAISKTAEKLSLEIPRYSGDIDLSGYWPKVFYLHHTENATIYGIHDCMAVDVANDTITVHWEICNCIDKLDGVLCYAVQFGDVWNTGALVNVFRSDSEEWFDVGIYTEHKNRWIEEIKTRTGCDVAYPAEVREFIPDETEQAAPLSESDLMGMIVRQNINAIITDDATASRAVEFFPGLKGDGSLIAAGTRINWKGQLKRAAVDLWDTETNNPDNARTLWEDINYKNGIRVIPEVITAGQAFGLDEIGWRGDKLYKSIIAGNVWTPESHPAGWIEMEGI